MKSRRAFFKLAAAAGIAPAIASAQGVGRVVVVGGGFAGATCARSLKTLEPALAVTLVEADRLFTACPMSSEVIVGLRELKDQEFGYDGVRRAGIEVAT